MRTVTADGPTQDHDFRLPAVDRAMSLFELLANAQRGLTLSEVSRKLNIPKSTAHYLVHTLVTRGYVQRGADRRHFSLGMRLADVASASSAELNLRMLVTPYLRRIATRINLTTTATVLRGAEAVIIARIESAQDSGGGAWIGRHIDLHCTAQGKALISTLSDGQLEKLLGGRELARYTPKTICSIGALKAHLEQVRTNGFAVNDEEHAVGVRAVAAPITNGPSGFAVAVSVRGSVSQIPITRFPQLGREMIIASREISMQLSGERLQI